MYTGACLQSVMVNEIGVYGPSECEDFCRNLPDCTWFTYYSDLELCTALTECVKLSGSVGNPISGQIKCLGEPQCNINGRCTGKVIIEKSCGGRLRFWLDLGQLAVLKKTGTGRL